MVHLLSLGPYTKGISFNGSLYETSSAALSSPVFKRVVCSRSVQFNPMKALREEYDQTIERFTGY